LALVYGNPENQANRPKSINVLIPDTMKEAEAQAYRQDIEIEFHKAGFINPPIVLIAIPIKAMLENGEALLAKSPLTVAEENQIAPSDKQRVEALMVSLRKKLDDLKTWSERMSHWRQWKKDLKARWNQKTSKEKDRAVLTVFGATRGLPGVAIYANDAGVNPFNIVRMIVAYSLDIFFSVASQKIASFPEKMRFPDLSGKTQKIISWAGSFGLMAMGYWGAETNPSLLQFQLSQASPFVKQWFDRNIELKAFLFGYSLSLGIPLTFLTLGYFAKGGADSGALSPFDVSFLLQFAGLQIVDGVMSMFGGRGARVLGAKGYFSGRRENIFFSTMNLLGQGQGLGVGTDHLGVYRFCLFTKSVAQGLTFFVSRVLPAKSPNVFIFHGSIGDRDRESYLYTQGILDPKKSAGLDGVLAQISSETPGPAGINRWIGQLGALFIKSRSPQMSVMSSPNIDDLGDSLGSSRRCVQALQGSL
jgi:hypothetical protein